MRHYLKIAGALLSALVSNATAEGGSGKLESLSGAVVQHEIREGVPIGNVASGVLLKGETPRLPPPSQNLPVFPNCERDDVRRQMVGVANIGNVFSIDFIVFSDDDREQIDRAKSWPGPAILYRSGEPMARAKEDEPLLSLITTLDIRCLPTRFHYVNEKGRQYAEYKEGGAAWITPTQSPAVPK